MKILVHNSGLSEVTFVLYRKMLRRKVWEVNRNDLLPPILDGSSTVKSMLGLGVCFSKTGVSEFMTLNQIKGIRAAIVHDITVARSARRVGIL